MLARITATQIMILSFLIVIIIGSILLYLPFSQVKQVPRVSYIDSLFTAVSATCVTGLLTLDIATQWNLWGQIIILIMIQIGGIGLVTVFTFFIVQAGKKVTMKNRMAVKASLNQNTVQNTATYVRLAIKGTLLFEGIGTILLALFFWYREGISFLTAIYYGVFLSISAFCNAGFDVIPGDSLIAYVNSPLVNLTIMSLIVMGGIGFTVWRDLQLSLQYRTKKQFGQKPLFALHTKLALIVTIFLIFSGAIFFFVAEFNNPKTLGTLSTIDKVWASFFQSITLRTAGFYTIDQGALTEASKFISSVFFLIGGSPGGTAGGIKTVTVAVLVACVWTTMMGKENIDIFHRRIPSQALKRAISVVGLIFFLWIIVAILLKVSEAGNPYPHSFLDTLFETASALGTVGLSTGLTPHLSSFGKFLDMFCMFVGRIGPIAIATALQHRSHPNKNYIQIPQEDVLIG